MADAANILDLCRRILTDPRGFVNGQPIFRDIFELEAFVKRYGGKVA
jgi:hypothetical protein